MATAKEFVARINKIDGVSGCLLIRDDGVLLGQAIDDPEIYSSLLVLGKSLSGEIMQNTGFSYCRHLSFSRGGKEHFYIFPVQKYLLGVVQRSDAYIPDMLEAVYRLLERVSSGRAQRRNNGA